MTDVSSMASLIFVVAIEIFPNPFSFPVSSIPPFLFIFLIFSLNLGCSNKLTSQPLIAKCALSAWPPFPAPKTETFIFFISF